VFVERDHSPGFQNLVPDVKVLGVSVQLVDLDDEFRNRLGTGWSLGTAQSVLAIILFENQGCGRSWALRTRRSRL